MRKLLCVVLLVLISATSLTADNPHGPTVVFTASGSGLTSSISPTSMLTPSVDTNYLILFNADIRGNSSSVLCEVFYTNPARSTPSVSVNAMGVSGVNAVAYVTATANNALTYLCNYSPSTGANPYDFSVTVVKM